MPNYIGPDVGVDWAGRNGFPCTCRWSGDYHGDTCPEHGKRGVPLPTAEERHAALLAENATLRRLLTGALEGGGATDTVRAEALALLARPPAGRPTTGGQR